MEPQPNRCESHRPPIVFLLLYRVPFDMPADWRRERRAVYFSELALLAPGRRRRGAGLAIGFGRVALVHLPVILLASIIGVWLFAVQHRSEQTLCSSGSGSALAQGSLSQVRSQSSERYESLA
jgi:hypothetical protein